MGGLGSRLSKPWSVLGPMLYYGLQNLGYSKKWPDFAKLTFFCAWDSGDPKP